jgi:hypothetical protein
VQLDKIKFNSKVVQTSLIPFTGNGPRKLTHTTLIKKIIPDKILFGDHTEKQPFVALKTGRDGHVDPPKATATLRTVG